MIVFTAIGLLFFWWFCWELGYMLAMACDAKARVDELLKPVSTELEAFIEAVTESGKLRTT